MYPFIVDHITASRVSLHANIVEDRLQHLMFFASDRIVPYVHIILVDSLSNQYTAIGGDGDCNIIFHTLIQRLHHFISLHTLLLSEKLTLHFDNFDMPPSPPSVPLVKYFGPQSLFPLFSNGPTLLYLELICLESGFHNTSQLIMTLSSCGLASCVVGLTIKLTHIKADVLKRLHMIFPQLENLQITVQKGFLTDISILVCIKLINIMSISITLLFHLQTWIEITMQLHISGQFWPFSLSL